MIARLGATEDHPMIVSHRILLVDDDLPFRRTLEVRLAREGYDVRTAADGVV